MSSGLIESKLDALDLDLDQFERSLGLPVACPEMVEQKALEIMRITPSSLEKLSDIECGESAFVLLQYAMYLQKACNKIRCRLRWCEENIFAIIAPLLPQQKAYSLDERKALAIQQSGIASSINGFRVQLQIRLERIMYLTDKLDAMARSLLSLQSTKRAGRGSYS